MTLIVAALLGIALVDFVVQNTRREPVEFFWASGRVPVAVALLVAALGGASVAIVVGVARMAQLRRRLHEHDMRRTDESPDGAQAGPVEVLDDASAAQRAAQ
jgi:uncharacterized integral membrane protein